MLFNPDCFLITPGFVSFVSSEYRLGVINWFSLTRGTILSKVRSDDEKLEDDFSCGLISRGSGLVCESGGGGGLRREFWYPEAFVESIWLRIPDPSKGAPMKSSRPLSFSAPRPAGVLLNSDPARTGDGADICRSSEELEDEEGVCLELE